MQELEIVHRSKNLIKKGEIELLFDELSLWLEKQDREKDEISFFSTTHDNLILLSSRYKGIINNRLQGVEEPRLIEIQKAKISKNLLTIVNSIEHFFQNGEMTTLNKERILIPSKKVEISLSFNRNFDSFSTTDQEWILKAITSLLNMEEGEVKINKLERGSVIITFELEENKALELKELAKMGVLSFLGLKSLSVSEDTIKNENFIEEKTKNLTSIKLLDLLTQFLLWCSGAIVFVLKQLPSEKNKYIGIGASILSMSVFAMVSSFFAFSTIVDHPFMAIPISLAWGVFIFSLARYMVASIYSGAQRYKQPYMSILRAIPRLAILAFIAITVAVPLQLKIFETKINLELFISAKRSLQDTFEEDLNQKEELIAQIEEEISNSESTLEQAKQDFLAEADGKSVSQGRGPLFEALEANYEKLLREHQVLLATNDSLVIIAQSEKDLIQNQYQSELATLDSNGKKSGFLERIMAKGNLLNRAENTSLWWTNLLITCLFIMIFLSPILIKILSPKGPYEVFIEDLETAEIEDVKKWKIKLGARSRSQVTYDPKLGKKNYQG